MTKKTSPYDGFRAMEITRDGQRNLEVLMRELVRSPEFTRPADPAISRANQVDPAPSQESRIAALESKIQTMEQDYQALERQYEDLQDQIENLREEMRRMVYRIE